MTTASIIVIATFLITAFTLVVLTRKEYNKPKYKKQWVAKAIPWQWVILISGFSTLGIIGLLTWSGIIQ